MTNWRSRFRRATQPRSSHFSSLFTSQEWEALQLAPLWAFMVVGMSDGEVDEKEKAAFLEYLAGATTFPLGLPRDVLVDLNGSLEATLGRFAALARTGNPQHALAAVASVVGRKAPRDEAIMYKAAVLDVGAVVARASGKRFRKNVSSDELNRIMTMQRWLRLDTAELASTYDRYNERERGPETTTPTGTRAEDTENGTDVLFSAEGGPTRTLNAILGAHETADPDGDDRPASEQGARDDAGRVRQIVVRAANAQRGLRGRWGRSSGGNAGASPDSRIGRQVTQKVYQDMSIDDQWSEHHDLGFTWWAHRQAQHLTWTAGQAPGEGESAIVVARTDTATDITNGNEAVEAANALNMSAGLSAIVLSEDVSEAQLISTVSVHADTLHHARVFSLAVGFQIAEANELGASIAQALGGRLDVSDHPHEGRRIDADEVLDLLSDIPLSRESVPLSEADFGAAAEAVRSVASGQLIAAANARPHGLTVEFPFDHSIPAAALDPTNPDAFLGTSLLTLAVLDDVADAHWHALETRHPALPILGRHTGAHTRYGSGLYVRLGLPVNVESPAPAAIAAHLNRLESEGASGNHLLGAWYGDDGIWFTTFYPNMLIAPLPADQRLAMLINIVLSQAARSGWAKAPVAELVDRTKDRNRGSGRRRTISRKRKSAPGPKNLRPSQLSSFAQFRDAGIAPQLTYCEIGETFEGSTQTTLPVGARIELWINCEAAGRYAYPHAAVAFNALGDISGIATAELMPDTHDSCYFGLFANGRHTNYGDIEDWRDPDTFFRAAIPILAPTIR